MGGVVKGIGKVVSGVSKVASKISNATGGLLFPIMSLMGGGGVPSGASGAQVAEMRRQELLLKQQEAQIQQDRIAAEKEEQTLDLANANIKNAALARRKGRGGLAFTAPTSGLKNTFGG